MQIIEMEYDLFMVSERVKCLVDYESISSYYDEPNPADAINIRYVQDYYQAINRIHLDVNGVYSPRTSIKKASWHHQVFYWLMFPGSGGEEIILSDQQVYVFSKIIEMTPQARREVMLANVQNATKRFAPGLTTVISWLTSIQDTSLVINQHAYREMYSIEPLWEKFLEALRGNILVLVD